MPPSSPSDVARGDDSSPDDDLTNFLSLLNELKATGCNLLVVGEGGQELFTRASSRMLGDDEEVRYRALAVTDATSQSIADRLPDPAEAPRPISETTHVINHAGAVRSVTAATSPTSSPALAGIKETRIADCHLEGLQSALVEAIEEFAAESDSLHSTDIRVGINSLEPLLDFYGEDVVRRCLRTVGESVQTHDAMAHYVLAEPYESDLVQSLAAEMDAVVEVRVADSSADHLGEQRWHVMGEDLAVGWMPL